MSRHTSPLNSRGESGPQIDLGWPAGGIPTRERCAPCHRISAVGFWVPDHIWYAAVHPSLVHSILCLACFTDRADARMGADGL